MPFFDFHIHPTLKCMFSDNVPAQGLTKLSPWTKIDNKNIPKLLRWCSDFEYIIETQASLTQLANNDCNLICIALYSPEKDLVGDSLLQSATTGPLGKYIQKPKLNTIINGKPYQLLLTDDLQTITDAAQFGITDKKVKPLNKKEDYNENDTTTIHAVFSVEGLHTFSSALQHYDAAEIMANLDDLRSKVPLLSLNLTHMEQSPLCNHAFGMQFLNNDGFKPTGNGISADGVNIIKHCYAHKVMVDIKHASLAARLQLYSLRNSDEFKAINQPIVCTHAGFTGISIQEIPDYIYHQLPYSPACAELWQGKPVKYGSSPRPSFNASSINLYDDDIIEILRSGGMIGLSLDKRILGFQAYENDRPDRTDYPLETEYISALEANVFIQGKKKEDFGGAFEDGKCLSWNEIDDASQSYPLQGEYHLLYFMAHIMHLIVVAQKNNYDVNKALKQICIGSDFDGLINPIWVCGSVDELIYFKTELENKLEQFAKDSNVDLPDGFNINTFSNQLFFSNGKDFVLNRLDVLNN